MLNCTPPEGSITGNADIVGPGVLSAFFVTAVITIIAVVVAYLSDSLDNDFLNELDRMVISWAIRVSRNAWAFVSRQPAPEIGTASPHISQSSQAWKEAIQQFILALSDQQLVTGLAILISGIVNQNNLSGYEFSVMMGLAWFSSTTHLATLDALRTYLKTHGGIRHVRVFGIVCMFILLIYALAITMNVIGVGELRTVPVQCYFSGSGSTTYGANSFELETYVLAIFLMASGYTVRIVDLYVVGGFPAVVAKVVERMGRRLGVSGRRAIKEAPPFVVNFIGASAVYSRSFLSSLSSIAFSFTYGISQIILYRWTLAPPLTPETNYMGFGQIMAIFLLILPFFTAGETYYGYLEKWSSSSDDRLSLQSRQSHGQAPTPLGSPRDSVDITQASHGIGVYQDHLMSEEQNTGNAGLLPNNANDADSSQNAQANNTTLSRKSQLIYGLFWLFGSLGCSVALGVLLTSASTNYRTAVAAYALFALFIGLKLTQAYLEVMFELLLKIRTQREDTVVELSRF